MISRVFYALSLLAFGQDVQLSMAAVWPLDLPFATRLVVYHLERQRFNAKARERSGSRQSVWQQCKSCERCLGGTHLRRLRMFVETIGTDIAGVVVAVGKECNLMYVSEADVTDLRKLQPGFASLWIRSSQPCALRVRTRGVSVTTLLKR